MKKLLILLMTTLLFVSCERLMIPKSTSTKPANVFEDLWETLDQGYVYFGHKEINWDSVYGIYRVKLFDTMTEQQLFDTCAEMLSSLRDERVTLNAGFSESYYDDPQEYKQNFNRELLKRNYWKGYQKIGPFIYNVIDSIGYVHLEDFDMEVKDEILDIIIEDMRFNTDSIRGVIFDVRNCEGDNINNAFTMLKRMGVDTNYQLSALLFKTIYKNGPEHDDFTDAQTSWIEQSDKTKFPKRFIMLTNRGTKGAAALFVSGSNGYSNVRVWGDTTGGGADRLVGHELPNKWQLKYPGSVSFTGDGLYIEDGIPPERVINMDPADEDKGKDTILETALAELRKK